MSAEERKREAAEAALTLLPESGVIGLGTGSTAKPFIEGVARLVKAGRQLVGVPTSAQSQALASSLGIPLLGDDGPWDIDVTVDGADEVSADLQVIKGGGACHLREKIVNQASRRNLIIVDESKLSQRLGERWPVPVEVVQFGHLTTARHLAAIGQATLRQRDGAPVRTDSGHLIYDVAVGPIESPSDLDRALRQIPGVVETGLFIDRVQRVIVAGIGGVRQLQRP
ncbi:MAG: ribose-5-phosphate isomerase RpiA [Polyangiaceae bacterium]|nr:ribose-5-phosphate isomerase RpiA [Polyangiaceae bacterium]MCW5789654.1 ribose-5-phosphate isomerase RpiA [Polyangiaceae bacterium]